MDGLFSREVRRASNLFAAWRHVRSSASTSSSTEIRTAAEDFEVDLSRRIASVQQRLAKGKFEFPKSTGVLKDKEKREKIGKDPRPLVIATIESRVVQRAILQVLQPAKNSALYGKIGALREVAESRYNFGGTPDGGVPRAISNVLNAIRSQHVIFFKSDIGSFFTKIPHVPVIETVRTETGDDSIAMLFGRALNVELENREELAEYFDLFPKGGVGVPQGSSLSAFSGNVLLSEFDQRINKLDDVVCYRYIDDLLILGRTNEAVQAAKSRAEALLRFAHMRLYQPGRDPEKAASGHVRTGLTYLGVSITGVDTAPARESRTRLLSRVGERLATARSTMNKLTLAERGCRTRERVLVQALNDVDSIVYGWGQSYNFVSNRLPFSQVDKEIYKRLQKFLDSFARDRKAFSPEQFRRALGVALLSDIAKKRLPS